MTTWDCDGWAAYHDFMPGKSPTLRVSATCHARTEGYDFKLVRDERQGINPKDLMLRLNVREPGSAPEILTDYPVEYVEETDFRYDTVSVVPDGPTGIPVENLES